MTNVHERRRSPRTPTSILAIAKGSQGFAQKIEITDLSAEGCAATVTGHPLVPGAVYGIKLDGLEGLASTAQWSLDQACGLVFDRPLYPAVAAHIAAANPPRTKESE